MNVLEDYGISKICFQHVNEGFKVAPELAAFGAGASQTVFGSQGGGDFFSKLTAVLAAVFFVTSFSLAIIAKNHSN